MATINSQTAPAATSQPPARGKHTLPSAQLFFALIILLGAWLRFEASTDSVVEHPIRADATKYVSYAYNMTHWNTYSQTATFRNPNGSAKPEPDAVVNPGYPALLALILGKLEPDWDFVKKIVLLQAVIGTITILLTYIISHRITGPYWALLPTTLVAISPKLIISGTYILTETVFTALLMTSLAWIVLQSKNHNVLRTALIGGILFAATTLIRPTTQYVIPLALMAIIPSIPKPNRIKYATGMTLGFLLLTTPWMIRNITTTGRVSDPTMTISALVHGHYPDTMYNSRPETKGYPYRFDPQIEELSKSVPDAINGIAKRVYESPGNYISWYLVGKPTALLSWEDPAAIEGIFTYPVLATPYGSNHLFKATLAIMKSTHWMWVALALLTVAYLPLLQKKSPPNNTQVMALRLCSAMVVYFLLIHAIGFPIARYHIPLLPVLFILAGYALSEISRKIASTQNKNNAPASLAP
ncbi:glycosyltransferase family 39 protein [Stutzerimonas nitrititolerans]|uniref:glycosyltransferase family 39 protein n=1 Tax=Stutzerimonas nitrititolerans TaxID=2482751 RepID=UPI0028A2CEE7|nr:glycosyltransferase family 39 protein [Stutzerimonas nitrititolerans]